MEEMKTLVLGEPITLEDFVSVARFGRKVEFSPAYTERVARSRALVEQWVEEERVMYGVTTGFGALCTKAIDKEATAQLQENIILSHSVSVGEPLSVERVRGIMLMVLQNIGQGYSGVRMCVLERYRDFLNAGLTPYAPGSGSVGYLSPESPYGPGPAGPGEGLLQRRAAGGGRGVGPGRAGAHGAQLQGGPGPGVRHHLRHCDGRSGPL